MVVADTLCLVQIVIAHRARVHAAAILLKPTFGDPTRIVSAIVRAIVAGATDVNYSLAAVVRARCIDVLDTHDAVLTRLRYRHFLFLGCW
jgi:hypothetical protein